MLSRHDDFPIHQTPEPLAHPATSDRNAYDRYWFNGFSRRGELCFEAALGLYPNRGVMDASFSVVRDGVQHSFHGSRAAPAERSETRVGPLSVEVVDPMKVVRIRLAPNPTGIECDLTFRARTAAIEEPRTVRRSEHRRMMDSTRFTQFGSWDGHLGAGGRRADVAADDVLGTRDRSWGIRPVGEPDGGRPLSQLPQLFWLWSPIHFDDFCTLCGTFEDENGRSWHSNAVRTPAYPSAEAVPGVEDPRREPMRGFRHRIDWERGTRWARRAEIEMTSDSGEKLAITLEPLLRFHMLGLGYQHPQWGHGLWKGEEAIGGESWKLDEVDPLDFHHLHVQQVCRARLGEREGVGVLEQIVFGPHQPSGFDAFLDGAK